MDQVFLEIADLFRLYPFLRPKKETYITSDECIMVNMPI